MESIRKWLTAKFQGLLFFSDPTVDPKQTLAVSLIMFLWLFITIAIIYASFHSQLSFANSARLPGEDASSKLEAAGILLKTLDTGIFKWGARIFAGLCIMSSAWALKEQRFGIAIICVIGAIIFGTAPKWVKNIFEIGDNQSLFSKIEYNLDPKINSYLSASNFQANGSVHHV